MDTFYEKISLFFNNFKKSKKSPKHFSDLLKILNRSIERCNEWPHQMGKLFLLMLVFEQITLLKEYLVFFNSSDNNDCAESKERTDKCKS